MFIHVFDHSIFNRNINSTLTFNSNFSNYFFLSINQISLARCFWQAEPRIFVPACLFFFNFLIHVEDNTNLECLHCKNQPTCFLFLFSLKPKISKNAVFSSVSTFCKHETGVEQRRTRIHDGFAWVCLGSSSDCVDIVIGDKSFSFVKLDFMWSGNLIFRD